MLGMVVTEDLWDAERRVWDAFPTGRPVELGTGDAEDGDPARGEGWGPDRQVRADVLAALLCGAVEVEPGQVGEIYLDRAHITGKLKLRGATLKHRMRLNACYVPDGIDLSEATAGTLELRGCRVGPIRLGRAKINGGFNLSGTHVDGKDGPALTAPGLTVTAGMFCDEGFQADGEVNLLGASIGGQLSLDGARLNGKNGHALIAQQLTVAAEAFCDRLQADGQVTLAGASIGSQLSLRGARLNGKNGHALIAQQLTVAAEAFCDGLQADGQVILAGASIGDLLSLSGARLNGKERPALSGQGLTVTTVMFCDGLQADGEVDLSIARVGSQLTLSGARLDGKGRTALNGQNLTVSGGMFCNEGFQADGTVALIGASIGGQLIFDDAHVDGKDGPALTAPDLTVSGGMSCDGFEADGEVVLLGASIGGQLFFRDAHLGGKDGAALNAERLSVTAGMFCDRFEADGPVTLAGASIGTQLSLKGAHLNGKDGAALNAVRLSVTADMFCGEGFQADGEVDLTHAKIGALVDARESWPQFLCLDGLLYSDLTYMPARERLGWLSRSTGYSPQPYEQLAGYYRRLGHDEQARRVLLAKQRHRRRQRPWWARWWGWLQDALAGYGYAPGRALLLLAGAFVAGWLVFSIHHPAPAGPAPHPAFNAALYTLAVLIPAPALGQPSDWDPQGVGLAVAAGLHILGWLLAITVLAAITRSFSRT